MEESIKAFSLAMRILIKSMGAVTVMLSLLLLSNCRPSGAYEGRVQVGEYFQILTEGIALVHPPSHQVELVWAGRSLTQAEREKLIAGESIITVLEKKTPSVQVLLRFKPDARELSPDTLLQYQMIINHVAPQPITLDRQHFDWKRAAELGGLQGALEPGAEVFVSLADTQRVELPELQTDCKWRLRLKAVLERIKPKRS